MTTLTIKSFKHPDILHYEWQTTFLADTDDYLVVSSKAGRQLTHYTKGAVFTVPHDSIEIFMKNQWFSASFDVVDNQIVSAYCNIAHPPVFLENEVHFVDFDVDYIKRPERDWQVVDEDEFLENSIRYGYSEELKLRVYQELHDLIQRVENKTFPFNEDFLETIR